MQMNMTRRRDTVILSALIYKNIREFQTNHQKNDKKKMPTPNGVGKQHKHKTSIA